MSGARIVVDDAQLRDALQRLARLGKAQGVLKSIGMHLVQETKRRFREAKGPDGQAWAPLHPLYAATKRGPGILRELGNAGGLMGSITYQVEGNRLTVGTNKIHAAVHQFGATIVPKTAPALAFRLGGETVLAKSVTIPARPYLGVSREDEAEILTIIGDFVARATGAAPGS